MNDHIMRFLSFGDTEPRRKPTRAPTPYCNHGYLPHECDACLEMDDSRAEVVEDWRDE